jgi:hypothetical protein
MMINFVDQYHSMRFTSKFNNSAYFFKMTLQIDYPLEYLSVGGLLT